VRTIAARRSTRYCRRAAVPAKLYACQKGGVITKWWKRLITQPVSDAGAVTHVDWSGSSIKAIAGCCCPKYLGLNTCSTFVFVRTATGESIGSATIQTEVGRNPCGNGTCDSGETYSSCPSDCPAPNCVPAGQVCTSGSQCCSRYCSDVGGGLGVCLG
jgi:hypothetical protein